MSVSERSSRVAAVVEALEVLGVTGVDDRLQDHVKSTLEALTHAGIKVTITQGSIKNKMTL